MFFCLHLISKTFLVGCDHSESRRATAMKMGAFTITTATAIAAVAVSIASIWILNSLESYDYC